MNRLLNLIWGTSWAQQMLVTFLEIDLTPIEMLMSLAYSIVGFFTVVFILLNKIANYKRTNLETEIINEKRDRENVRIWQAEVDRINKEKKEHELKD